MGGQRELAGARGWPPGTLSRPALNSPPPEGWQAKPDGVVCPGHNCSEVLPDLVVPGHNCSEVHSEGVFPGKNRSEVLPEVVFPGHNC